jgi:lipopolysaccharide export LptBFGC system permease protein LptF
MAESLAEMSTDALRRKRSTLRVIGGMVIGLAIVYVATLSVALLLGRWRPAIIVTIVPVLIMVAAAIPSLVGANAIRQELARREPPVGAPR